MPAPLATTPLTYNSWLQNIASLAVIYLDPVSGLPVDQNFLNNIVPQCLNYAELRIQRDLDLLALQTDDETYTLTAGSNILPVYVNDFVTIQTIQVVNGTKATALVPTSKEFLMAVYDDSSIQGLPRYFGPLGGDNPTSGNTYINFLIAPTPDQNYPLVIIGSSRIPSLASFANNPATVNTSTTFISTWLPDLLVAASMIYVSGYQRNFSASGDDPQTAVHWEQQYQALSKAARTEEACKRFRGSAWSSEQPSPIATPART